jgi:hypothetical protein
MTTPSDAAAASPPIHGSGRRARRDDSVTPRSNRPRRFVRWMWAASAILVCAIAFVLYWFQPQKLIIDDRATEAVPAGDWTEVERGDLTSLDHRTSGVARVLQLDGGDHIVRLEGLETSNGPDLFVYLSANPAAGPESAFDDDYVSLGRLKGNIGDQNYTVPAGTPLDRLTTIVIWCDRFDAAFGAADLAMS